MLTQTLADRFRRPSAGRRLRVMLAAIVTALALSVLGLGAMLVGAQGGTATATPAAGGCPAATPTSGSTTTTPCIEIGEYDIYFKPNQATIPADTPVRIVLVNHGATLHNFSITDHGNAGLKNLNISVQTEPGKTSELTINAAEGTYYFFCKQPGHEAAGMRGNLVVKKDATVSTAEVTVTPRAG